MIPGKAVVIPGAGGPTPPTGSSPATVGAGFGSDVGTRNPLAWLVGLVSVYLESPAYLWRTRHMGKHYVFDAAADALHRAEVEKLQTRNHVHAWTAVNIDRAPDGRVVQRCSCGAAKPTKSSATVIVTASDLPRGELTAHRVEQFVLDTEVSTEKKEVA